MDVLYILISKHLKKERNRNVYLCC